MGVVHGRKPAAPVRRGLGGLAAVAGLPRHRLQGRHGARRIDQLAERPLGGGIVLGPLDPAAAEDARGGAVGVIEDASLAGRDARLGAGERDFAVAMAVRQPGRRTAAASSGHGRKMSMPSSGRSASVPSPIQLTSRR